MIHAGGSLMLARVKLLHWLWACWVGSITLTAAPAATPPPNVVVIFCDDLGYADVGCFGAPGGETPAIDRMAREGIRFNRFRVSQAVCSASRAALLTGCYNNRLGIHGALWPGSTVGLSSNEVTIAEMLRTQGYATGMVGKWHLGDQPGFLPTRHGFDEYFGLPYSNDMWPQHPDQANASPAERLRQRGFPELPLLEGERIVQPAVTAQDQTQLTTQYTERAVRFIERHRERPFFLYVAHSMPHVPLFVSDRFRGRSQRGLYGDVVMELDWSVGQILAALRRHGLDERTLVIFTSDNGPWLPYGHHAGSAGPLREGKGTSWEGGIRVPFIARWHGTIPASTQCDEPAMTIDLLPTLARLTGASLPPHPVDGRDLGPSLFGRSPRAGVEHPYYIYYANNELQAVVLGDWKLVFPHTYRTLAGRPGGRDGAPVPTQTARVGLELYHLATDEGETRNVLAQHPDVVRRMQAVAERARADLGDTLTGRKGRGLREPGRSPATVTVDAQTEVGRVRPVHGVNSGPLNYGGTLDFSEQHRAIGIPLTRLHDCQWPSPAVVDHHAVFPRPEADASLPSSYDFAQTDDYIRAIVETGGTVMYRLGESIEHTRRKSYVHPPADPARWAAACVGIARHYNDGWADGFRWGIRYWEVWNEPENRPTMWTGNDDDYYRLYAATVRALKAYDATLKVGGPSAGHLGQLEGGQLKPSRFLQGFIRMCRDEHLPLDFLSWHRYTAEPGSLAEWARAVRRWLDEQGFATTESHLNEWNFLPYDDWGPMLVAGQGLPRRAFYQAIGGAPGAAFTVAALSALQDAPVDMANYYAADHQGFGWFDTDGVPKKNYHAFRAYAAMRETPVRLSVTGVETNRLSVLAGMNETKTKVQVLVSHLAASERTLDLRVTGLPWKQTRACRVWRLDRAEDEHLSTLSGIPQGSEFRHSLILPGPGFLLVTLEGQP